MRILGLDVGTKTVGVAMSDEMGWTAQGLETIKINEERGHFGFDPHLSECLFRIVHYWSSQIGVRTRKKAIECLDQHDLAA